MPQKTRSGPLNGGRVDAVDACGEPCGQAVRARLSLDWRAGPVDPRSSLGTTDEAHLPAQATQARPRPRFPHAHVDPRRPPDAQASSRQGPQAADRLTVEALGRVSGSARRPKKGRLSRSAEFERVYRQGRSLGNRHLVLYVFPRGEQTAAPELAAEPRLGLSVSRK